MAEYIERKALIKRLKVNKKWSSSPSTIDYTIELAKTIPTADVVKVVRCKDCEFVKPTKIKINGKDLRSCDLYKRPCCDDDFCSQGVLKECEGE